jgi:hypothetical protein
MADHHDQPRNSYNDLWGRGYQYAEEQAMPEHRCEQFASTYARVFEGQDMIATPADFMAVADSVNFDYTGKGE